MKLAFTVCSLAYLGQAKAMADSFIKYNPAYQIKIGIVDRIEGRIEKQDFAPYELTEIEEVGIPDLSGLTSKYNGLEMCCLAKPFMASYLLEKYPEAQHLIYADTDILFFNSVEDVANALESSAIFLTPHIFTPYPDLHLYPLETSHLNSGLYNAGFWAISRGNESQQFLDWWKKRLITYGFVNFMDGMFVDQLWLNYVPLFFQNVVISQHLGLNVGYWNLHERSLQEHDGNFTVNNQFPLVLFHYSGYNIDSPKGISAHTDRFDLDDKPELMPVFQLINDELTANRHDQLKELPNLLISEKEYMKWGILREYALRISRKLIRELHG
ncbi:MAG: hypothetical protein ACI964_000847 [Spirosomataceae bacterium]|jgi:hypothetical protein